MTHIIQDSSPRVTSKITTFTAYFSFGLSDLQKIEHPWKSRSYTSSKSGMERRTLPELWLPHDILFDSEKDRWPTHTLPADASEGKTWSTCAKHIEDCKVGTEEWLVRNFDLKKDVGSVIYRIHQTAVFMPHHPTQVTRTISVMEPSSIEPTNVPNCSKQVINHSTTMGERIMVSNRSIMARSLPRFWLEAVTRHVTPIRIPQLAVATFI